MRYSENDGGIINRRAFVKALPAAALLSTPVSATSQNPCIVITYDDGKTPTYDKAWPVHKEFGLPATTAVISSQVGGSSSMTQAQIQDLVDDGWEVMSHGKKHRYMAEYSLIEPANAGDTTVYVESNGHGKESGDDIRIEGSDMSEVRTVSGRGSDATGEYLTFSSSLVNSYTTSATVSYADAVLHDEMGQSLVDLTSMGFRIENFIYPGSANTPRVREIALQYYNSVGIGYKWRNGSRDGWQTPPFQLASLDRINMETDHRTDGEIKDWLDDVVANNALGIAGGHPGRTELPEARIRDVLQWAEDRGIDVLTFSEALPRFGYNFQERCVPTQTTVNSTSTTVEEELGLLDRIQQIIDDLFSDE